MFHNCKDEEQVNNLYKRFEFYLHPNNGGEQEFIDLLHQCKEDALKQLRLQKIKFQKFGYEHVDSSIWNQPPNQWKLQILDELFEFSKFYPRMDIQLLASFNKFLNERGYLTSNQYNSLVNIYYLHGVDDLEKWGLHKEVIYEEEKSKI